MGLNTIVIKLLSNNKKAQVDEAYKSAYIDGALDFYNEMKKNETLMFLEAKKEGVPHE